MTWDTSYFRDLIGQTVTSQGDVKAHGWLKSKGPLQCMGDAFVSGYLAVGRNIHSNDPPAKDKAHWSW